MVNPTDIPNRTAPSEVKPAKSKRNGPLGEGWDEKAPGNRKRDRTLGSGWDDRVPKEGK